MMNFQSYIDFVGEDREVPFKDKDKVRSWLKNVIASYGKALGELTYIFCSDDYMIQINRDHLNHDYYTDVITFDYCENNVISGDIFISLDMITYNAEKFLKSKENELKRVMAHGVLHLCGLKDKSDKEVTEMREAEDIALALMEDEL